MQYLEDSYAMGLQQQKSFMLVLSEYTFGYSTLKNSPVDAISSYSREFSAWGFLTILNMLRTRAIIRIVDYAKFLSGVLLT